MKKYIYTPKRNRIILKALRWISKTMLGWTGWTRPPIDFKNDPLGEREYKSSGDLYGDDLLADIDMLLELSGDKSEQKRIYPTFVCPVRLVTRDELNKMYPGKK